MRGTCRRRTTFVAFDRLGEPRFLHHLRHGIPSTHASLERARRAPRGDVSHVREDGPPRRLPARPDRRGTADRRGLPDRTPVRRGGRASRRSRLVGHRVDRHAARRRAAFRARPRPTTARPTSASRSRTCCERPAMRHPRRSSPTLPEVAAAFAEIEAASGPARKSAILRTLLERSDPLTAKYIVKVLGGDLRIGLREGLVEAAIARAFDRGLDDVKWAGMLVGDVGRLAALARDDALATASLALFHPLKFMLASPAEDAAEIITRLGPEVWVEDKYDGIRAQLHKRGTEVRLYSRDLHDVSSGYPEIVAAATPLGMGRDPRWRDPRLARRHGPAVHRPPDPPRAEGAVGGDPGRGPGHLRRVRRARARAGGRRPRRGAAPSAADRAPVARSTRSTCRWPTTAAGSRARISSSRRMPTRSRRPSSSRAPVATRA